MSAFSDVGPETACLVGILFTVAGYSYEGEAMDKCVTCLLLRNILPANVMFHCHVSHFFIAVTEENDLQSQVNSLKGTIDHSREGVADCVVVGSS